MGDARDAPGKAEAAMNRVPTMLTILACAAAANCAAQTSSPVSDALAGMPDLGWVLVKMLLALGAIVGGLLIAARILSRRGVAGVLGRRGGLIEVIDVTRLEPRRAVYLVRVAGQFVLLGTSETGVHTLAGGALDGEAIEAALRSRSSTTPKPGGFLQSLQPGPKEATPT